MPTIADIEPKKIIHDRESIAIMSHDDALSGEVVGFESGVMAQPEPNLDTNSCARCEAYLRISPNDLSGLDLRIRWNGEVGSRLWFLLLRRSSQKTSASCYVVGEYSMCKWALISRVWETAEVGGRNSWLCFWLSMNGCSVRNHLRANGLAPEMPLCAFRKGKVGVLGGIGMGFHFHSLHATARGTILWTRYFFLSFLSESIYCVFRKQCVIPMHKQPNIPNQIKASKQQATLGIRGAQVHSP
jgi:hypothetical protein